MTAHFRDAVSLLEACLEELQRQEAVFYAPFKPGDRIAVERMSEAGRESAGPYLVVDVLPDKKARYAYECAAITKDGAMYKRRSYTRIFPAASATIYQSDVALNNDGRWEAEYFRRCGETSRQLAFATGDITLFEGRKDLLDRPYYRRKDRLDP